MTNTFDNYAKDYQITFAYYIKNADNDDYDFGPTHTIIINDCFTEHQAEEKFWQLCGQGYEGVCLFDTEEVYSTEAEVLMMEKQAIAEHLFGTTQFGQTDLAIATKYSDHG